MTDAVDVDSEYRIDVSDHGTVRQLTLNRPDKLNAFTAQGYEQLRNALNDADADPAVSVGVLTGTGRAFSAGVDVGAMSRPGGSDALFDGADLLLEALTAFSKPLIAAVNGLAVGYGASLLLHCDLVLMDPAATVRMPFVALGTCMEAGSSWLLPRRVGPQQAALMVLTGDRLSAEQAVANGYALALSEAGHVLDDALALAERIAAGSLASLIANKRLLREAHAPRVHEAWTRERVTMDRLGPLDSPVRT